MNPARAFLRTFVAAALGLAGALWFGLALLDPYGVSPVRLPIARPIMDINQRFMYPQVARSSDFDSAVFGTSTLRLLDPVQLNATFGGRFANLAMNAATPWEQMQLAGVFMRAHPRAQTVIFGFDTTWCEFDADKQKLTYRAFPASFYDENPLNDLHHLFNIKTLEIAGRLLAFHLKRAQPRIRADGYDNFLPDDSTYDLVRARDHIWGIAERFIRPAATVFAYSDSEAAALRFPAMDWLEEALKQRVAPTRVLIVIPPAHVARQPRPGTQEAAQHAVCQQRLGALGQRYAAPVINMQIDSAITRTDANYWDSMHYRVGIAGELVRILKGASAADAVNGEAFTRLDR